MTCPQCVGIETQFGERTARRELERYRRKGAHGPTRILADAILDAGGGETLLDIGGGVGALQHVLLEEGTRAAISVDASSAYLQVARQEAERRGLAGRVDHRHGDFLEVAAEISPSDIVTLDKVVCCYPELWPLVTLSAERARRLWGAVYPRPHLLNRIGLPLVNLFEKVRRIPFRVFLHPPREIDRLLVERGFVRRMRETTLLWEIVLWERREPPPA